MSGTIAVAPDKRWSAAGWLFEWAVEALAEDLDDDAAVATLREIIDDNLGWLGLDDLSPATRAEVLRRIRTELVDRADRELPPALPNRSEAVDLLRDLSRLAETA
ncbi:hypothetical protein ACFQZ4_47285 [Catellatospora coxensis]|uniref:Uncharacterized protein n=1 Tax=Catellatospora coxensis TaxID=310354 RepID=A0A8J3KQS3_9ACTN|nr:hypothetical protein [Catellatospora coxensis]GIG07377.1 hypothetical protein Cco03nite_40770 [Catellatospora coxensis]